MTFAFEKFFESGFNHDLTGNAFDLVLFERYHLGIGFHKHMICLTVQRTHVTYVCTLWFKKDDAREYFETQYESATYTYRTLGLKK